MPRIFKKMFIGKGKNYSFNYKSGYKYTTILGYKLINNIKTKMKYKNI